MRNSVRADVWDACGGRCHYCGAVLHPFRTFEVDHVISQEAGGTDAPDNLVGSCTSCNRGKASRQDMDGRREVQGIGQGIKVDLVADLMRERAWNRAMLASRAKVSIQTVHSVMSGRPPQHKTLHKLAEALGVKPGDLVSDE